MKQYRVTSQNLNQDSADNAYLAPDDPINELKVIQYLGGINAVGRLQEYRAITAQKNLEGSNISATAAENARIMRDENIKPGTPEWFKLWFSLPYLTGEKKI